MEEINVWLAGKRDYAAGVALYNRYGKERMLHLLFAEARSEFKERRLALALAKLANGLADVQEPVPVATMDVTAVSSDLPAAVHQEKLSSQLKELEEENAYLEDENADLSEQVNVLEKANDALRKMPAPVAKGWPAEMDATLQELYNAWLPLFKTKKDLQARITDVALAGEHDPEKEKEAGKMAHEILDLRDAIRAVYKKRDHYLVHKTLPQEPTETLPNLVTDPKKLPTTLANHKRYLRDYKAKWKAAKSDADRERLQKNIDLQQRYIDHYQKLLS